MMTVVTVRNLHRYQVEERILDLLFAEVALFAVSFLFITFFYAKMAMGGKICRNYLPIQRPLTGRNLPRTKKQEWCITW